MTSNENFPMYAISLLTFQTIRCLFHIYRGNLLTTLTPHLIFQTFKWWKVCRKNYYFIFVYIHIRTLRLAHHSLSKEDVFIIKILAYIGENSRSSRYVVKLFFLPLFKSFLYSSLWVSFILGYRYNNGIYEKNHRKWKQRRSSVLLLLLFFSLFFSLMPFTTENNNAKYSTS